MLNFPFQLDDPAQLYQVRDFAVTQLASDVDANDTIINVVNGDMLPNGRHVISLGGTELVVISSNQTNQLIVEQRGAFGTIAQGWPSATGVVGTMSANHYQLLVDGMLNLQQHGWEYQPPALAIVTNPSMLIPSVGSTYLVGMGAVGEWAGKDRQIAKWDGEWWQFINPTKGMMIYVDQVGHLTFGGSSWIRQLDYQMIDNIIPSLNESQQLDRSTIPPTVGNLAIDGVSTKRTVLVNVNSSTNLTVDNISINNVILVNSVGDVTLTLPTGSNLTNQLDDTTNQMFEWSIVNTNSVITSDGVDLVGNQDHTIVGNRLIQPGASARFGTMLTGSGVWFTYQLS